MKVIISGCNGKMGTSLVETIKKYPQHQLIAGVDKKIIKESKFPVYSSLNEVEDAADVLIDFSHPSALEPMLEHCLKTQTPTVICTTGLSEKQVLKIKSASKKIAIFYSRNMSLGINVLINLVQKATQLLGDRFDIEIIEKHHNQKIDAPSGTALMIAEKISQSLTTAPKYVFDRTKNRSPRSIRELGIHSIRGGSICGDHEIIFAGKNEILTISHHAQSRDVFSEGAIKAAEFICGKPAGLYSMEDMLQVNKPEISS